MTQELHLADAERVAAILDRMARRIEAERTPEAVLVGILRRGGPLAEELGRRLRSLTGGKLPVGSFRLERYDDDLTVLHDRAAVEESSLDVDVDGRDVILIDDVLYSGETAFRAAETLRALGARGVRVAVLCRRGAPRMPVHASYVGLQLDVGPGWIVDVAAPPYEEELGISIKAQP